MKHITDYEYEAILARISQITTAARKKPDGIESLLVTIFYTITDLSLANLSEITFKKDLGLKIAEALLITYEQIINTIEECDKSFH